MNNTEILKNAPDGWTHVFQDHEYILTYAKRYKDNLKYFWFHPTHRNWYEAYTIPQQDIRSRADIEALVAKDKRIAELEANQAKRDLEQQAKGLERVELPDISINESMTLHEYLLSEAAKLREKAQELSK